MTDEKNNLKNNPAYSKLDNREREILKYSVEGKSSKFICFHLTTTERTVDLCKRQIAEKLGLESILDFDKYYLSED